MRVVSLGFALPNQSVDNHSIANAPSLFEYDACFIDPRAVSRQIEEIVAGTSEHRTADAAPVLAGASGAFHYGLAELLQQRRQELVRLLDRGGLVVLLGYPNVPHPSVSALPGADRYTILPGAPGVLYRPPQLLAGAGSGVRPVDPTHPFSVYIDDLAGKLRYQAHWDVAQVPEFDSVGTVIARSHGGAAVAVEFRVGPGRVVFVPPPATEPRGETRRALTAAVLESITRSLEGSDGEEAPAWSQRYGLPGLAEARERVEAAESAFAETESRLVEARAALADVARFQGLLWRQGPYGFAPLVRDAFRALGFSVTPDLQQPAELKDGDEIALLEVDASAHTVKEQSYLKLQRRIEEEFLRSGVRRKGVIAVNGKRRVDPKNRAEPYSKTLTNACESFGYALITGDSLFTLTTYALEDAEAETLAEIRQTILNAEGVLVVEERDEAVADADDEAEPEAAEEEPAAVPTDEPPAPVEAAVAGASEDGGSGEGG